MSEVDVHATVLRSFVDVKEPRHLSLDSEGHVLVAESHRILLLNSQLQLQRVLVDTYGLTPAQLCYNELTSQLYVLHSDYYSHAISQFHLRYAHRIEWCFVSYPYDVLQNNIISDESWLSDDITSLFLEC